MSEFGVRDEKEEALRAKMARLGIREEDLVEKFVRSGGHGGQKLNKTATCVYLRHVPTGMEVKCQRERSQALNRFLARRILVEKIEAELLGRKSARVQKIEKAQRQKRKRAKRAAKKHAAEKHKVLAYEPAPNEDKKAQTPRAEPEP
ncbi:MAG: peptide chain release factor family protein [Candidatus Sumerlaeaceae bacterium]